MSVGSQHFWNAFSNMRNTAGNQRIWVSGNGCNIIDNSGQSYLDGLAGLWYMLVGYGRSEIAEAVHQQMSCLPAYGTFWNNLNEPSLKLSDRLANLLPGNIRHIFYSSGGSEANETALKIARQYFLLGGEHGRYKVIGRRRSYHGVTMGALSASGITANRRMFGPFLPGFRHVPHSDIAALRACIEFEAPETIAAIIAEPIMGAGGVILPPDSYLADVRALCDEFGILLIADEVICGFGRTGRWFGVENWNVVPDIMTMAKGITSGYLPLGATAASDRVYSRFVESSGQDYALMHGNTYSGHPTACAAALANLDIIEKENLVEKSREQGKYLLDELRSALKGEDLVHEIRGGVGLLAAVELAPEPSTGIAAAVATEIFNRGVIVRPVMGNILAIAPPLIIDKREIQVLCAAVADGIRSVGLR